MLAKLLGIRLRGLFSSMATKEGKRRSLPFLILLGILFLYLAGCFLGVFALIFGLICPIFTGADAAWGFFTLASAAAAALQFLGSIVFTQNQLYEANDNEFLLSLPVAPRTILLSRLLFLLIVNYFFEAIVLLPAFVIWLIFGTPTFAGVVLTILCALILPCAILALSCLFGWCVAKLSKKIRRKQLLTLVLTLGFLAVYFFFIFRLDTWIEDIAEADILAIIPTLGNLFIFTLFGEASVGGFLSFVKFALICAAFSVLVFRWLERTFFKTVLTPTAVKQEVYRESTARVKTPLLALAGKELSHLTASAGYMLNAGLGLVFLLLIPVVILIKGDIVAAIGAEIPELAGAVPMLALLVNAAIGSMIFFTACTVSLEGKNLWIVRTCPVRTRTVLQSKILFQCVLTVPAFFVTWILYLFILHPTVPEAILLLLSFLAVCAFCALFGLFSNLLFPKLDWKNEMVPIKQGGAVLLAMFGGMAATTLPAAALLFLAVVVPAWICLAAYVIFLGGLSAAVYAWCMTRGAARFEKL